LLLKIMTRAMLENQTAMLSTLQAEMTRQDIQGEAKQHSILQAAIHYIYDTLAPDEQGLLLCLAPLKFAVNTNTLLEYSQRLRQHTVLAHLPFDNWDKVLEKVADWGLLRLHPGVLLQSAFADFLRSRLGKKAEWRGAIEMAFSQYCDRILKNDFVIQTEMPNQKDVQTSTQNEEDTLFVPITMSSIDLYNIIEQAAKNNEIKLDFSNQGLTALLPEIGKLSSLRELDLSGNQLTGLPLEISQLSYLRYINLKGNKLTKLPLEIFQLSALEQLDLSNNLLTELPSEISKLSDLEWLDLRGNQLDIPSQILEKTERPDEIINFYLGYKEIKKPLNEAKILVVGEGEVGKTSLVKCLCGERVNENEKATLGVNIKKWEFEKNSEKIRINIWDFGGQEDMHTVHQKLFLVTRCLYMLVLDSRQSALQNRLEYWLKLINTFGKESPIIVVSNWIDDCPSYPDVDKMFLTEKYQTIKGFFETSALKNTGILNLQQGIKTFIDELGIHDQLPYSYFRVKEKLEYMRQYEKSDYIVYDQYVEICEKEGINNRNKQNDLIEVLSGIGTIIKYNPHNSDSVGRSDLSNTYVISPGWITDCIYSIITSKSLRDKSGILDKNQLEIILDQTRYPEKQHNFIIEILRHFELCFDMAGYKGQKFAIPLLFPQKKPPLDSWYYTDNLQFQYHYEVFPPGGIAQFIVKMHKYIFQNLYWHQGVILKKDGNKALVTADIQDKIIFIWITGTKTTARRLFLERICDKFEEIHDEKKEFGAEGKIPYISKKPPYKKVTIIYKHLIALEEQGIPIHYPEELYGEEVTVSELLNGYREEKQGLNPTEKSSSSNVSATTGWGEVGLIVLMVLIGFVFMLFGIGGIADGMIANALYKLIPGIIILVGSLFYKHIMQYIKRIRGKFWNYVEDFAKRKRLQSQKNYSENNE